MTRGVPMYRYRPLEAHQWEGRGKSAELDAIVDRYDVMSGLKCSVCGKYYNDHGEVNRRMVCPGSFIVRGLDGDWRVLNPEDFHRQFELAT